jgi:hypothetical protein
MVTIGEAEFHMLQTGHLQEWFPLLRIAATIPLRRSWIPSSLQYLEWLLLHHHSIMVMEMAMAIAAHPVQAQMVEAMAMALGAHR